MSRLTQDLTRDGAFDPPPVTFSIRQTVENGTTFFEVWRRACDAYGECWESLVAESHTRADAGELLRHHAKIEDERRAKMREGKT